MIKPLGDRLLVKLIPQEEKTTFGILLPEASQEKALEGTVIAAGKDVPADLVGKRILFAKYAGEEINDNGERYLILRKNDVQVVA